MNNNLEQQLNQLKPQKQEINIADKVLQKIEKDKIKMRPGWMFKLQKFVMRFGFIILFIIMAFLINLTFYDMRESNSLEFMDFGTQGLSVILANMPYILMSIIGGLFVCTIWLMSKFEISYKKPFAVLVIVLVVGTFMGGSAIFASDFNEQVQEKVDNEQIQVPLLKPVAKKLYQKHGPKMFEKRGLIGRVINAPVENEFMVQTPQGKEVKVKLMNNYKILPSNHQLQEGDLIIMLGKPLEAFHAKGIKLLENKQKAKEMFRKLKPRPFQMKFKQIKQMRDFQDFHYDREINQEFRDNVGGFLQSGQNQGSGEIRIE